MGDFAGDNDSLASVAWRWRLSDTDPGPLPKFAVDARLSSELLRGRAATRLMSAKYLVHIVTQQGQAHECKCSNYTTTRRTFQC